MAPPRESSTPASRQVSPSRTTVADAFTRRCVAVPKLLRHLSTHSAVASPDDSSTSIDVTLASEIFGLFFSTNAAKLAGPAASTAARDSPDDTAATTRCSQPLSAARPDASRVSRCRSCACRASSACCAARACASTRSCASIESRLRLSAAATESRARCSAARAAAAAASATESRRCCSASAMRASTSESRARRTFACAASRLSAAAAAIDSADAAAGTRRSPRRSRPLGRTSRTRRRALRHRMPAAAAATGHRRCARAGAARRRPTRPPRRLAHPHPPRPPYPPCPPCTDPSTRTPPAATSDTRNPATRPIRSGSHSRVTSAWYRGRIVAATSPYSRCGPLVRLREPRRHLPHPRQADADVVVAPVRVRRRHQARRDVVQRSRRIEQPRQFLAPDLLVQPVAAHRDHVALVRSAGTARSASPRRSRPAPTPAAPCR